MGAYITLHTGYGVRVENLFSEEEDFLRPEACEVLGIVPGSDEASLEYWITDGCPNKDFETAFIGDLEGADGIESQLLVVPKSLKDSYWPITPLHDITVTEDFNREDMDKLAEAVGDKAEYYAFVSMG